MIGLRVAADVLARGEVGFMMLCFPIRGGQKSVTCYCVCVFFFFFSSRRRHTRFKCDWSSDVCSSDLGALGGVAQAAYNRLRYTAKRTMSLAQKLYEGVELGDEGSVALITYMRTEIGRASCRERV